MKTIKFRVWDKCMYYPSYNLQPTNCDPCGEAGLVQGLVQGLEDCSWIDNDVKIQQFIGLSDKNGREIYENDILKIKLENWGTIAVSKDHSDCYEVGQVIFDEDCAAFRAKLEGNFYSFKGGQNLEVIGNIFENKELLG